MVFIRYKTIYVMIEFVSLFCLSTTALKNDGEGIKSVYVTLLASKATTGPSTMPHDHTLKTIHIEAVAARALAPMIPDMF
jgi:hypothetical protein